MYVVVGEDVSHRVDARLDGGLVISTTRCDLTRERLDLLPNAAPAGYPAEYLSHS